MKISLYLAISIDGYIAKNDGDSDWIGEADFPIFDEMIADNDAIIVGNTTFQQFKGEIYPIDNTLNIVLSSKNKESDENIIFSSSIKESLEIACKNNCKKLLIVGGGHLSGSFLKENLIDEIIVDIQPIILGKGIKIFEDIEKFVELYFVEHTSLDGGLNILKYTVKK